MPTNGPRRRTSCNTLNADSSVFVLPYGQDLLEAAAHHIIGRQTPPDLSHCSILLPDLHSAAILRRRLLSAAQGSGFPALLGPTITTLSDWLKQQAPLAQLNADNHVTRLMLVESLRGHPELYGNGGPWALADSLIVLFDELTRQRIRLPQQLITFTEQLGQAYKGNSDGGDNDATLEALTREATLVHTLWQAWQEQLQQEDRIDTQGAHIQRLTLSCERLTPDQRLYLIGFDQFSNAEADWLRTLMSRGQAELILHGNSQAIGSDAESNTDTLPHHGAVLQRLQQQLQQTPSPITQIPTDNTKPEPAYSTFINTALAPLSRLEQQSSPAGATPLPDNMASRAQQFSTANPNSPLQHRLSIISTANPEQQARAVDVQIRRWLLEGKRHIAIVCADLRLTRRLRALLERANIHLRDQNGWTLSTSRAAAVLERLLQTAEEDYDQQPLLDLLKSPFILPEWDEHNRLTATYRLERDIIRHENIARGLQRYRQHITWRQRRLGWPEGRDNPLNRLLDDIETVISPLLEYINGPLQPTQHFLDALHQAMTQLGLNDSFATDPAGKRLLEELQQLQQSLDGRELNMDWLEFRSWLGQALEQAHFLLPISDTNEPLVQLLTLTDTPLQDYDALLFASADQEHLPTTIPGTPFFNDAVRHELNLELASHHHELALARFRNLLERAPQIIFSWHQMADNKPVQASPWLTILNTFHQLAYGYTLNDPMPLLISQQAASQIFRCDERQTPSPLPQPRPTAAMVLPDSLSASRYQRLIDCPYRFFSADCLGLKAEEDIQQTLEKSDYGQRVHRILQAFHADIQGLPGPFTATIDNNNRSAAQQCLEAISHTIFANDLEDNALHRSWLQQWLELIPAYLDWQQQRQQQWQPEHMEMEQNTTLNGLPGITLNGRLDRIDSAITAESQHDEKPQAIIDYKTGTPPKQEQVDDGEAVQLPFYALLHEQPLQRVEYLQLGKINARNQAKTAALLEGNELAILRDRHAQRLEQLFQDLRNNQALPAWGDDKTCSYCDMDGLCRRQVWEQDANHHAGTETATP